MPGTPRYVYTPFTGIVDELALTAEGYPNGSYTHVATNNAGSVQLVSRIR